ncbi:MAG TPA: TIGR03086 family metal-binding protein [Acidimicrobiales bacterium]|nr:TIGR03086 family metal-binding protein [Acidimicrobiales bacterium]
MDVIDLLDEGFGWTAKRVAGVRAEHLESATPCAKWDLRHLVNHTLGSLSVLTEAVSGEASYGRSIAESADLDRIGDDLTDAFDRVAASAMTRWRVPGALDGIYAIPLGPTPGQVVANINLLEVVVHGWDIARSTGETEEIPAELADPVLRFAQQLITNETRGDAFAPSLAAGATPSEQLVAFLGRQP